MSIESARVKALFNDCVINKSDGDIGSVLAEGISLNANFHPERIFESREEVKDMLSQLPDAFRTRSGGNGESFLEISKDNNGVQWTKSQEEMEYLVLLGIGIGGIQNLSMFDMKRNLDGDTPKILVFWGVTPSFIYIIADIKSAFLILIFFLYYYKYQKNSLSKHQ